MSTITTSSQYGDLSMSEILAARFLAAKRVKMVMSRHVNEYSIAGMPSDTLKLSRYNYLGRAAAGTEGVKFSTFTQLGASSISPAPSEFALAMAAVTGIAVATRVPGFDDVTSVLAHGTEEQKVNLIAPEAMQLSNMLFEKHEYNCLNLATGLSRSAGPSTATDAFTVPDFEDALYTLEAGETLPHDNIVYVGPVAQVHDVQADARQQTGIPFNRDLASIVEFRPDLARDGLKGALIGVPVYQHSPEATQFSTTSVANDTATGAMFLRGQGDPEMSGAGYAGCFAFVQGQLPYTTVAWDQGERAAVIQLGWIGDHIERVDLWGVKTISRSTR